MRRMKRKNNQKEEEVVDEDEEEDENEDEDEDEDDGKEPRMIGQGVMVHPSGDDIEAIVDDRPFLLPEQHHQMHKHTPWPQPPAPAPQPQTLEPRTRS